MTVIYDLNTKEKLYDNVFPRGFSVKDGDVLNINGERCIVKMIEYFFTGGKGFITLEEKRVYVVSQ